MSVKNDVSAISEKLAAPIELSLFPLDRDPKEISVDGCLRWKAFTCDPAFEAKCLQPNITLEPCWYVVRVDLVELAGHVAGPRIYMPDERGLFSEARAVEFKQVGAQYEAEIFVARPIKTLRFDPSVYPCEFSCGVLKFTPIPAPEFGETIFARLRDFRLPSSRLFMQWCRTGIRLLVTQGPRTLVHGIYETWLTQTNNDSRTYPEWIAAFSTPDEGQGKR